MLRIVVAATLTFIAVVGYDVASSPGALAQSPTLVARAGDGEGGYAVNAFLPEDITVAAGTVVRWDFQWWEPHTVTFGVPASGSPEATPSGSDYSGAGFHTSELLFGPGKHYEVRFTTPGAYQVYCVIHPGMTGTVTVVGSGQTADSQAELDTRAVEDYARELQALKSIAQTWIDRPLERTSLADGSTQHTVYIAGETSKGDVQQFFPTGITVQLGDTVRWRSVTVTPHTVTFGPFPEGVPRPGNPAVDTLSKPSDSYTGSGYWNSGVMGIDWPGGHEFAMKFGATGTFNYYCIPHVNQGMAGVVTVEDASAPGPTPIAPATGNAGTIHEGSDATPSAMVLLMVLAAVSAPLGVRRHWRPERPRIDGSPRARRARGSSAATRPPSRRS